MSTICFAPEEIKGLAETLIASGHDREQVYNLLNVAHAANAVAYEARYGDTVDDVQDLRDDAIIADTQSFLAVDGGVSHLLYNCDDALPRWAEDALYTYVPHRALHYSEAKSYFESYQESVLDAIKHGQANIAAHLTRLLVECAYVYKPSLKMGQASFRKVAIA